MGVRSLVYVGLTVRDLNAWAEFASGVLGLPSEQTGDRLRIRMDERAYRFDLRAGADESVGWLGWEVADAGELEAAERRLKLAGAAVQTGDAELCADRGVAGLIWTIDPAGLRHEICYGQEADFRPLHLTRPIRGYRTGEQGVGHVVLGVTRHDESVAFLADGLGLRVSDTFGGFITFMHCNARHHSIALVGTDEPGLRHIMLEALSLDDVGSTIDECLRRGLVTRTLGRHTNDQTVSFYFTSPSGWEFEYGWGGLEVDDDTWCTRQLIGPTSLWGHQHLVGSELRP